jgi:predicted N-acetyltransferase YhbS
MNPTIETLRVDEFDAFMRYVERAFGHSRLFFQRVYPHLYQPTEEACSWAYVIHEEGEIVSHVGLYPIEVVTAGVRLSVGGIGAVSTAPRARGKGYMTHLLNHVVEEMRRLDYPISWLSGDRQRYNSFGWEVAVPVYTLSFTRRSLTWHEVQPASIEEVLPEAALPVVARLHTTVPCHTLRPHLDQQIHKMDRRIWIAEDGYAILRGQGRHHLHVEELVSASGDEVGILRALLDWTFGERVTWRLSAWDAERLGRVMPYAGYWEASNNGMFRVNDLAALLAAARPALAPRAAALRDFAVTVVLRERDRTQAVTVAVGGGTLTVTSGEHAADVLELSSIEAARLFLGGPAVAAEIPAPLKALLPVPVFVPPLDYV